jgi:hypothetical protein
MTFVKKLNYIGNAIENLVFDDRIINSHLPCTSAFPRIFQLIMCKYHILISQTIVQKTLTSIL